MHNSKENSKIGKHVVNVIVVNVEHKHNSKENSKSSSTATTIKMTLGRHNSKENSKLVALSRAPQKMFAPAGAHNSKENSKETR